jgi:DNA-directed RNA polymerase beta' subunit
VKISLASSEKIRQWSHGEVKKPETINYRTFKPERDGLFCAKIFGPVKDYECLCGKYKRMKHRGITCEKCQVEVIQAKVRRERLGHIELATPVAHIWFLKSLPSRITALLAADQYMRASVRKAVEKTVKSSRRVSDEGRGAAKDAGRGSVTAAAGELSLKDLEKVLYCESYMITDPGETDLLAGQVLAEEDYQQLVRDHGFGAFEYGMGGEVVRDRLRDMTARTLGWYLRRENRRTKSEAVRRKLLKWLKVVDAFTMPVVHVALHIADPTLLRTVEEAFDSPYLRVYNLAKDTDVADMHAAIRGGHTVVGETFPVRGEHIVVVTDTQDGARAARSAGATGQVVTFEQERSLGDGSNFPLTPDERRRPVALPLNDVRTVGLVDRVFSFGETPTNHAAWMMLEVVPVIPPDLRPLVPLDGGRFATSDLNDLYRRVINRNNRLRRLLDLNAPEIIIRNEKRMLQEAVDALFDNGRRSKGFTGPNKRLLRSLSDMLKGKHGRFRQNLLGKRVDYSGRSVIVVGPELRLHECGLPKKMALELFKPFIYAELEKRGLVTTIKAAKKAVEKEQDEVWDILDHVIKEHPVMLNRAPTLHRLGIQAFEPVLIEGKAIRLHPLVCTAFNADFDGDQMAVHVPLSIEAQIEARVLMMSTNNILSPASGRPIIQPSQDVVLGCYYMTRERSYARGAGRLFADAADVQMAYDAGQVDLQAPIEVRMKTTFRGGVQRVKTTTGRVLFSEVLPRDEDGELLVDFAHINKAMGKKQIGDLIDACYRGAGAKHTVLMADRILQIGFRNSTLAGISICLDDMRIPEEKAEELARARKEAKDTDDQYNDGYITRNERRNKLLDIWGAATDAISKRLIETVRYDRVQVDGKEVKHDSFNSIWMMVDSGARGSQTQIRQLGGMRGLMAKPNGEILERPITKNFREGLSVLDYFMSTHGARKGLADTALKTANSGYLTRRLCDVVQDVIVTAHDCGTTSGYRPENAPPGSVEDQVWTAHYGKDKSPLADVAVRVGLALDEVESIVAALRADAVREFASEGERVSMFVDGDTTRVTPEGERFADQRLADALVHPQVRFRAVTNGDDVIEPLADRVLGRTTAEPVWNAAGRMILKRGTLIDEAKHRVIAEEGLSELSIRSVMTCDMRWGVCAKCYGRDLARGELVNVGEAIGVIAAQSIGEPGTQLTMRTFHVGGAVDVVGLRAKSVGRLVFVPAAVDEQVDIVKSRALNGTQVWRVMSPRGVRVRIESGAGGTPETHFIPYGATVVPLGTSLRTEGGETVWIDENGNVGHSQKDGLLGSTEPSGTMIFSQKGWNTRLARLEDAFEGKNFQVGVDQTSGIREIVEPPTPIHTHVLRAQAPLYGAAHAHYDATLDLLRRYAAVGGLERVLNEPALRGEAERKGAAVKSFEPTFHWSRRTEARVVVFVNDTEVRAARAHGFGSTKTAEAVQDIQDISDVKARIARLQRSEKGARLGGREVVSAFATRALVSRLVDELLSAAGGEDELSALGSHLATLDVAAREAEVLAKLGAIAGTEQRPADVRMENGDLESVMGAARAAVYASVEFMFDGADAVARMGGMTYVLPREADRFVHRTLGSEAAAGHAFATLDAVSAARAEWAAAEGRIREAVRAGLDEALSEHLEAMSAAMSTIGGVFVHASKDRGMWEGWLNLGKGAQDAARTLREPEVRVRLAALANEARTSGRVKGTKESRAVEKEIGREFAAGLKVLQDADEAPLKAWYATWELNFHEDAEIARLVVGELEYAWTTAGLAKRTLAGVQPDEFKMPFDLRSGVARPRVVVESGPRGLTNVIEQVTYSLRAGYSSELAPTVVDDAGREVDVGTRLAWPQDQGTVARDITSGLPRIAELFEARKPKDPAILAEAAGTVSISDSRDGKKGKRKIVVRGVDAEGRPDERAYLVPKGKNIQVNDGDHVQRGDMLVLGQINPHDWLKCHGEGELARWLVEEIQLVYRLQSVKINDKHIEVVVRQMLRRVRVTHAGKSSFLVDEPVEKHHIFAENERLRLAGHKEDDLVKFEPLLLGITKASLSTDSFLSAASFQETTRVLTEAAIYGRKDTLRGLKENILMGRLIPAGTGFAAYAKLGMLQEDTSDAEVAEAK